MATIYCFSATGNSLYAAKRIAQAIGGEVKPMNGGAASCGDGVVGFVFPVYFWGLPRMVERFVSALQIEDKSAYVFAVATSGGPGFGVLGRVRQLLRPKGVSLRYGRRIVSVSNYLPQYVSKDSPALREAMDQSVLEIADAVNRRASNRVKAYTLINRAANALCPGERSDRHFTVSPRCTGCATCQEVCPVKNVHLAGGRPDFLHRCEHCLACVHNCPARAIDWKGKTQGKERYRHSGVALDELIALHAGD